MINTLELHMGLGRQSKKDGIRLIFLIALLFFQINSTQSQSIMKNTIPEEGFWVGEVYEGSNNLESKPLGKVVALEMFDDNLRGDKAVLRSNNNKKVKSLSVRYKMHKSFERGRYTLSVGADEQIRLSIDGGKSFLVTKTGRGQYTREEVTVTLDGEYELVIECTECKKPSRISFDYTLLDKSEKKRARQRYGVSKDYNKKADKHNAKGPFLREDRHAQDIATLMQR